MDGKAVRSCLILAAEAHGASVTTVEGLANKEELHPLQQAFVDHGAVQCGFCVPGMLMASKALLDANPTAGPEEIRAALGGHLCRCGGYKAMADAVRDVASRKPQQ
jgi:carbon-monoxide dehydrogenase small subunit